jgi:hypothetical protein
MVLFAEVSSFKPAHFSVRRVKQSRMADTQTSIANYHGNPSDYIQFGRIDDGVGAHYLRPLMFVSPGFVTCFPKTKKEALGTMMGQFERKYLEVDITMKGAGHEQEAFKNFMDRVDESLLDFIFANQSVLGKSGCTRDQLAVLMKRSFRPRMNMKTQKTYADAMTCRFRTAPGSEPEDIPVFDSEGNAYQGELEFNDIVSVVLKYDGCYCRAHSWFGNAWSLVAVKHLGKFKKAEENPTPLSNMFQSVDSSQLPQP